MSCQGPAPAVRAVPRLPTGDPARGGPRTASPGWAPPASPTGACRAPPSQRSPACTPCTRPQHGLAALLTERWSGLRGVPGNWPAPFRGGEAYCEVRFLPGGRVTREPILRAICFPPILLLIASELDANLTVILIMVPSSYGSGRRDPCSDATKPERGPFRRSLPGL
jgi:hypothetical protein